MEEMGLEIWRWIAENKDWLFSGAGLLAITAFLSLFRRRERRPPKSSVVLQRGEVPANKRQVESSTSKYWQGITPENSRYTIETDRSDSIPVSVQTFSFEYGPRGHAKPLTLKGSKAAAEIQMDCQIKNVYKAMFEGGEYALNFLHPRFLVAARDVLERYSLTKLRESREEAASEIIESMKDEFLRYGVELQAVRIGNVEKTSTPRALNHR